MNVTVVFNPHYKGSATGPLSLIRSEANQKWFDKQLDLDPNSALFLIEGFETIEEATCQIIWDVQDHYPKWETITVIGAELSGLVSDELKDGCCVSATQNGFVLEQA